LNQAIDGGPYLQYNQQHYRTKFSQERGAIGLTVEKERRKTVDLRNAFGTVVGTTFFVFSSFFLPETAASSARLAGNFAQVEITLNDEVTLADISGLARAPESDLEIVDGGKRVRVQLPAASVEALEDKGAQIEVLRKFVLLKGSASQGTSAASDVTPLATCSGDYYYGESPPPLNIYLENDYTIYGSGLDFSLAPGTPVVTCIDIHYEIRGLNWISLVDVAFSEDDYMSYMYTLVSGRWGEDDIVETRTGITAYNGESVKQAWWLWAIDYYADGWGYIDYWWIKLYYDDEPPPPEYCEAYGDCMMEYIRDVVVGTINNTDNGCTDGYSDFTSLSTAMVIGTGYPMTVVNGYPDPQNQCGIWVDWNQDFDFDDADETITVSGTPGTGPYTATITPPAGASPGDTRMRIRIMVTGSVSPCGHEYGEVEDYTITVTAELPKYGGGSGTAGDPYLIYTAEQMQEVGANSDDWDAHFKLMDNIDIGGYTGTTFNIIGTSDTNAFTGTFDGNDNTISNFSYTCTGTNYIGIFGYVDGADAEIKNLGLINPNVDAGTGDYVASLIGKIHGVVNEEFSIAGCYVEGGSISGRYDVGGLIGRTDGYYGSISNCSANCSVSGTDSVGGLIGDNCCSVSHCTSSASVSGTNQGIGGLVGRNYLGTISDSSSWGSVTSDGEMVGGLAGVNDDKLLKCYSTATVAGNADKVGGLVGYSQDSISRCYASGSVSGNNEVGGLVGYNGDQIIDSHAMGGVSGADHVGGLVGENWYATTTNCYSVGPVTGSGSDIGGLIGYGQGSTVTDCFWDRQTSWRSSSAGGTSKTTEQMQTQSTFTNWDFATPIWTICEGDGYPELYNPNIKYGGGHGTEENPYIIATPCHLQEIGAEPNDWDKHFKLTTDINLARYTADSFNIIGTSLSDPFLGYFDGDGHTISNFTYETDASSKIGIFGSVGSEPLYDPCGGVHYFDPVIKNLGLIAPNVSGGSGGSLAASFERGIIANCYAQDVNVSGDSVGGLVGSKTNGQMRNCYATGRVSGGDFVGGLMADCVADVADCYACCQVLGNNRCGGLIGHSTGSLISNCYADSNVSGVEDVGGLVGSSGWGTVENSYATGPVSGVNRVGGLVGDIYENAVSMCYSAGRVSASSNKGGLVGRATNSSVTSSYWDVDTSGMATSAGGTGKTTGEMKTGATFTSAGWDLATIWKMCGRATYPKLRWEKYGGGDGTEDSPCLICRPEEMQAIGAHPDDWDKHFKLMADIDMGAYTGTQYNIIGRLYERPAIFFDGSFDGNGHTVSNLTYKSPDKLAAGLFGAVAGAQDSNVVIRDLTLVDPNVDVGTGGDAGAIVGLWYRDGLISNCCVIGGQIRGSGGIGAIMGSNMFGRMDKCYSSADIIATGSDFPVGGLVGVDNFGPISQCSSAGSVTSDYIAGGLVGWTGGDANVTNCYSIATVDGNDFAGGLIGYVGGLVENCYSAGSVSGQGVYVGGLIGGVAGGSVIDSFWDVNTSGQPEPWAGTGLTTAEMQDPNTFILAGWDFFGEYQNGAENIWRLCEKGTDYPKLMWEFMPADFACPDGVGPEDLAILCDQWLESLLADFAPDGGDKFINFVDWTVFANAWQATAEPPSPNWDPKCDIAPEGGDGIIDGLDLFVVLGQWLRPGPRCADIAPVPLGDGIVSLPDFAVVAGHWLEATAP
jgi:hypothetical protein